MNENHDDDDYDGQQFSSQSGQNFIYSTTKKRRKFAPEKTSNFFSSGVPFKLEENGAKSEKCSHKKKFQVRQKRVDQF